MAITSRQLVTYARGNLGRMYTYGCFGQIGTETLYKAKLKQYPKQIGKWPKSTYEKGYGQKWHDCVGMIKGAVFCDGKPNAVPVYNSKFDVSANDLIKLCEETWPVEQMPKNITGLVMWKPGHVGVWDADTHTTIEAKGHMYGVCETDNTAWKKAGKLPASWVTYEDPEETIMLEVNKLRKGSEGPEVFAIQAMLRARGYKDEKGRLCVCSSVFDDNTDQCVRSFQRVKKLSVDGVVGPKTWDQIVNKD